MKHVALALLWLAGCAETPASPPIVMGDASADATPREQQDARVDETPDSSDEADVETADATPTEITRCATDATGLPCVLALHEQARASCRGEDIDSLRTNLEARHGSLPLWYEGRALFVTYDASASVAGVFNEWATDAATEQLCDSEMFTLELAIPSGHHAYKLVRDGRWMLDPEAFAFEYDAFSGNADGKNSVLNTYDSGVGHLARPDVEACSEPLMNCRPLTAYLPRGYGAPESASRHYPVLFMHDGQNVFDDTDCCFGHTGWEVNVTLDREIDDGNVQEVVVIAADHAGDRRGAEYAYSSVDGGIRETFVEFQVNVVQRTAAELYRLDPERVFTAGSSFGAQVAFQLLFTHPEIYAGAALLSGAWYPGEDSGTSAQDVLARVGPIDAAIYLDHGGAASGGDGYASSVEMRDLLDDAGWERQGSPNCVLGDRVLCYHHEPGATHDELAWKERTWRFLRFFFAPPP